MKLKATRLKCIFIKPEVIQTVRGIGYTLMVPKAQLGAEAT